MLNSLRVRLTVTFLLLALVPLVIVSLIVSQRSIATLIEQDIISQQLIAQRVETEIEAQLQESENELDYLVDVVGISSLSDEERQTLLRSTFSQRPTYNALSLLDASGQETVRISRLETVIELVDRSDQEEYTEVITHNALYYSPIYFSEALREPLVTLSIPICDLVSGDIAYVLVAELRFKAIWDLIAETNTDEHSTVYVTGSDGTVVAHRNPSIVLSSTTTNLPEEDGITEGLDGNDVILATQPLQFGEQELIVVAERNLEEAFTNVRTTRNLTTTITGIALLIAASFTYYSVDRIVRPIESLSKTAARIQEGDLTLRVDQIRKDELGDLAVSFNAMTTQLSGLIDTLEARVMKRTAELDEARKQAELASNAKSIFLSNMSHELRTPLNMVIGYTSSMLNMPQMYDGMELPPAFQDDVRLIQENGRYLLGLINDILDLSKIEVGKLEIHSTAVNLNEIFQGVIATSIGLLKDKQIQVRPQYEDNLPMAWADPLRLRQILLNLMSNAIKFTETGSVTLSAIQENDRIKISVVDTGVGIPEDALEVIFDRFEQVQSNISIQGTGLGLDISQRLAHMHGSEITIDSQVGQGSTCTFDIQIATPEQIVASQQEVETQTYSSVKVFTKQGTASLDSISVLLGSSSSEFRAKQREMFEKANCVVLESNKAEGIVEFATGLIPEIIVLDIGSFEDVLSTIIKPLRDDSVTADIPIIWLSNVECSIDMPNIHCVTKSDDGINIIQIAKMLVNSQMETN